METGGQSGTGIRLIWNGDEVYGGTVEIVEESMEDVTW